MADRRLIIEGGLVVTAHAAVVADLLVVDGRIGAVAAPASLRGGGMAAGAVTGEVVDGLGKFVLPAATVLMPAADRSAHASQACGAACWLGAAESVEGGNWLPIWYPSADDPSVTELERQLAEQVWGDGVPVVGVRAWERRRGADHETWLAALAALAAEAGVLVVLWLGATSTRRQALRLAGTLAGRGARLLLAVEDATHAGFAGAIAAALGGDAPARVWVASPPPSLATTPGLAPAALQEWWELVRTGAVSCLTASGAHRNLVARLYRDGVASGRVGLTCLANLVACWLRRHAGLSPPLTPGASADLALVDPEARELAEAEQVWVDGAPLATSTGRRERGGPLPWPH